MDAREVIAERIAERMNASQLGRSFNVGSEDGRQQFAAWFVGLTEDLGFHLSWDADDENEDEEDEWRRITSLTPPRTHG